MRLLVVSILLLISGVVFAAPLTEAQIAIVNGAAQKQLTKLLSSKKAAGAAFALIDEGKVVLLSANGVRQRIPAQSAADSEQPRFVIDTPMPVGGVSRLITTLIALKLVQQQKLDLSQNLQTYLPELRFVSAFSASERRPITLKNLLVNASGISRGGLRDLYLPASHATESPSFDEPIWLTRPAGSFSEQSFLADAILGAVIVRAGGADLQTLFETQVAAPLGLTASGFTAPEGLAGEHDEGKLLPARVAKFQAALGFHSSVRDLAKLLAALDVPTDALGGGLAAMLSEAQNLDLEYDFGEPGSGQGYAFGFSESVRKPVGLVGYLDSSITGHEIGLRLFPKHRMAVVAISNSSVESKAFSELLKVLVDTALQEKAGIAPRGEQLLRAPPETLALPAGFVSEDLQTAYATPAGLVMPDLDGDRFDFELGGFGLRADRRADGWYRLRYRLLGLIPLNLGFIENILIAPVSHIQRGGGRKHLLLFSAGSELGVFGSAISANSVEGDLGEEWIAEYEIANPDVMSAAIKASDIAIVRERNVLLLRATFDRFINVDFALPLNLISADTAILSGFGPGLGEAIRRRSDGTVDFAGYLLRPRR